MLCPFHPGIFSPRVFNDLTRNIAQGLIQYILALPLLDCLFSSLRRLTFTNLSMQGFTTARRVFSKRGEHGFDGSNRNGHDGIHAGTAMTHFRTAV